MTRHPAFLTSSVWTESPTMVPQEDFSTTADDMLQEHYILEMFQRVVVHGDQDQKAKVQFQRQLSETVQHWLRLHPYGARLCQREKEECYVLQTFERFWQMIAQDDAREIGTFATLVMYLRASLTSVILDTIRAYECTEMSISMKQDTSNEVWEYVQSLLTNARQQRIAYLLFHCGLQPKEIIQAFPEDFSDVAEIDQLRYKIITDVASVNEC